MTINRSSQPSPHPWKPMAYVTSELEQRYSNSDISLLEVCDMMELLCKVVSAHGNGDPPLNEVSLALRDAGADRLPLVTVEALVKAIRTAGTDDPLGALTIKRLEEIMALN
jgi:hypothetical protein